MMLKQCKVTNFGSYSELEFDFSRLGLALVCGPTGAGKSTLMDIPAWILFGITAKNGAADDVKAWGGIGTTTGSLEVHTADQPIKIYRVRGKANENDLFWEDQSGVHRGKTITETQQLLEERLGVSSELYLTAAYYSEFSPSANFFSFKAKDRRQVFENVAALDFPAKLAEKSSEQRKIAKKELGDVQTKVSVAQGKIELLSSMLTQLKAEAKNANNAHMNKLSDLKQKSDRFDDDKSKKIKSCNEKINYFQQNRAERLTDLINKRNGASRRLPAAPNVDDVRRHLNLRLEELKGAKCSACGAEKQSEVISEIQESLLLLATKEREDIKHKAYLDSLSSSIACVEEEINPHWDQLKYIQNDKNRYEEQLKDLESWKNPFSAKIQDTQHQMERWEKDQLLFLAELDKINLLVSAYTRLIELAATLRGQMLQRSVSSIQAETNRLLEAHFDSALKVCFNLSSDTLDVQIQKNGYDCNYAQLSKGQRQMLKLCFAVAVRQSAENSSGIHFDNLFFDEALDGLDTGLKIKAYDLFSELGKQHGSVLLIDHATEIQQLFLVKYRIDMNGDNSYIETDCE